VSTIVEGRVALVTGASSGIGAATAASLAAQGAKVALASRRGSDEGIAGALARSCDVRDPTQLEQLVAETVERFGGLDIVVANAGVGAYGDFLDISPEHLEEMVDVNVKGLMYTVRACLPHLLKSPAADLVLVASIAGQRAPEGESVYAASKFAQVGFMRSLDHELHKRGVRCSTIAPGGVWTEFAMGEGRGRTPEDADLPGMMRAQEIADAVVHAVTRPRTHRVLEATILPMSDDSMN
jgi:NADP-dependent 3-hydroxy acid dehydrogenase YdfG